MKPSGQHNEPRPKPGLVYLTAGQAGQMLGLAELLVALAEPALEPGDSAAGVEDLLLAGIERVAVGADVGVNLAGLRRAPGGKGVPAGTGHLRHHVIGMNVALHVISWFLGRRVATQGASFYGREPVPHIRHTSVPQL